jgi:DNA polymerase-3 subunit delta
MKLTGSAAQGYFRAPDAGHAGLLIFGADPMRVAEKRQLVITALVGPQGEEEMRLTRMNGADLRKDPAMLLDAIKAQGFFPGHRVVFVEEASDSLTKIIDAGFMDWQPGDAQVVVTAGQLTAKSSLRKVFENHRSTVCIGLYDDPPSRDEIAQVLRDAQIETPSGDVENAVFALAQSLEPGDFRQTIEKLGLYKLGDKTPLSIEDVMACAPQSAEVDMDDVLDTVAFGHADKIGTVLRNLYAQGVQPVTLCIGAMRHFRMLHAVASDPAGPQSGIGQLRPPVFGPRRDKLMRQAGAWRRDRLERALTTLTDTDLQMRSAGVSPDHALMERALIRLAMMARS